jgi:DNA-binding CsgD family transcriptional regulator
VNVPNKSTGALQDRLIRTFACTINPESSALHVLESAARSLLTQVPADLWCTVLLDPSTLLDTGGEHRFGFPENVMQRLFEIEHIEQEGRDNLRRLADQGVKASALRQSSQGELEGDPYYRDILQPLGLSDELRVVLRAKDCVWGLLVFCRSGAATFTPSDLAFASALSSPATQALRGSLVLSGIDTGAYADGTGLVVLDTNQELVSASTTAERWLEDLQERAPNAGWLPNSVRALAVYARSAPATGQVRSHARTRSGTWAALTGWALDGKDGPRTVISIGPAEPGDLIPIVFNAYGLTPRERDVMQHVVRGHDTAAIAKALALRPDTVQKHVQSAYRKVGVGTRQEFTAHIFSRHYAPHLSAAPLTTDGRLIEDIQSS